MLGINNMEFTRNDGRKCFYLMTHSTHFISGYMVSGKRMVPVQ